MVATIAPTRRGTHGLGSVRQRKDGRWEARLPQAWPNPPTSRYRRSEADALDALADMIAERSHPVQVAGTKSATTVATFADRWLAEADLSAGSLYSYRQCLRKWILPNVGRVQVAKLGQDDVRAMLDRMAAQGATPATRAYALRLVRNILHRAMQTTPPLVRANVALTIPTPRTERYEIHPPTDSEVVAILAAAQAEVDGPTYLALRLAADTGLRIGEVLGLQWSDVSWDAHAITVRATLDNRSHALGRTKTAKSRRTLRLAPQVMALVQAERRAQVERGEVSTFVLARRGGRVRGTGPVGPLDSRNVRRAFQAAAEAVGLPRYRIHDLRHAAATRYLAAGVPMAVASASLGHARVSTTVDTYGHLRGGVLDMTAHALPAAAEN